MERDERKGASWERARTALWGAGLVAWIAAPVLVIAGFFAFPTPSNYGEKVVVTVRPEADSGAVARDASLLLTWSGAVSVVAPDWYGITQRLYFVPGAPVASGDLVMRVANVDRVAYHSAEPFARPLSSGDTGPDVAALHEFLRARGFPAPESDRFGSQTRSSVIAFSKTIGIQAGQDSFDPGWLVYLPKPSVTVSGHSLVVGAPAPAAGAEVFAVRPTLEGAQLIEYVEPVVDSEGEDPRAIPPTQERVAAASEVLIFNGSELLLAEDRASVDSTALPSLEQSLSPAARVVSATLESPTSGNTWLIPTGALVLDEGRYCVLSTVGDQLHALPVSLVIERQGTAIVEGALSPDLDLVVAPPASERACQ